MPEHHKAVNQMLAFLKDDDLELLHRVFQRIGDETPS